VENPQHNLFKSPKYNSFIITKLLCLVEVSTTRFWNKIIIFDEPLATFNVTSVRHRIIMGTQIVGNAPSNSNCITKKPHYNGYIIDGNAHCNPQLYHSEIVPQVHNWWVMHIAIPTVSLRNCIITGT
jgi:hypothetical protein